MNHKFIALAAWLLASLAGVSAAEKPKPNIVYILADGRSTPGAKQANDVAIKLRKPTPVAAKKM